MLVQQVIREASGMLHFIRKREYKVWTFAVAVQGVNETVSGDHTVLVSKKGYEYVRSSSEMSHSIDA